MLSQPLVAHTHSDSRDVKSPFGQILLYFIQLYNTETFKLHFMVLILFLMSLYNKINDHTAATLIKYLTLFEMEEKKDKPVCCCL